MNDVSIKNTIIYEFIMGLLIVPLLIIMISLEKYNLVNLLIYIMPIWLLFWWWGRCFLHINSADISINNTNDVITLITVFYDREIKLDELVIKSHVPGPRRGGFIFYTNFNKIILNYTKNNYNIIVNVLRLKRYENIDQFIADVEKRASLIDLN